MNIFTIRYNPKQNYVNGKTEFIEGFNPLSTSMVQMDKYKNLNVLYDLNHNIICKSSIFGEVIRYAALHNLEGQYYIKNSGSKFANLALIKNEHTNKLN